MRLNLACLAVCLFPSLGIAGWCYAPSYAYYTPVYSYSYHHAGSIGNRCYKAGYYRWTSRGWYHREYGYDCYSYCEPYVLRVRRYIAAVPLIEDTVTTARYVPGPATAAAAGPLQGVGPAPAVAAAQGAAGSAFESRVLSILEKLDRDGEAVKRDVNDLRGRMEAMERWRAEKEGKTPPVAPRAGPADAPRMPKADNGKDKPPADPPEENGANLTLAKAHAAGKAACASCHTAGRLNKDTTFILFVADGRLAALAPAARAKVLERLVDGTMPPASAGPLPAERKQDLIAYFKE